MLKSWLIVFASFLIVVCNLLLVIDYRQERKVALDEAARSVENLSIAMTLQASRSFADVDHTLANLAATLTNRIAETDGRLAKGDPELTRLLLRRLAELDNVRALTVINEMGIQTIDSRIDAPDGIDLHDRSYFVAQRTAAGDALYLDRLAISRIDGRPFIGVSRRINGPGGSFAGVVVAVVDLKSFHAFYASLAGGGRSLALVRVDGTTYVQVSEGQSGSTPTVLACGDPFDVDGIVSASTSSEIVSCRRVPGYPLIAIASIPVDVVLASRHLIPTLLITLGIAVFTGMLLRRIGRHEQMERRFLAAFDLNPDAMGISRLADSQYTDVNQGFTELTGYARDEVIGRSTSEIAFWADPSDRKKVVAQLRECGQIRNREIRLRHKDGSIRTAQVSGRVFTLNGEPHIIFNARDVTESKNASEQLSKLSQAVTQSPAAIVITDRNARIEYVNPRFVEITGYGADEALGQNPRIFQSGLTPPEMYKELWGALVAGREWRGEILNRRKDGTLFWEYASIASIRGADGVVVSYVAVKEDITPRKHLEQRLHHQANFDPLTGLPNRALALERLHYALATNRRHQRGLALLFIDFDHFKRINDNLGHPQGDLFLKLASEQMKACIREVDTVARMGGDEFVIILPEVRDSQDVATIARRIMESFTQPFNLNGCEMFITASIGIALSPDNGDDVETLLQNADTALYDAKEKGRNRFSFFDRKLSDKASERLRIETHLRRALEKEEFWLAYQPLVDIRSGRLAGAEALLRWHNESLREVNTNEFIAVAESTGLIVPIGQWVVDTACRQASRWRTEGLGVIPLSINVSGCQFHEPSLADAVLAALQANDLSPSCLELEITERLLMENHPEVKNVIDRLKGSGIRLALDDFGTGYSSLSYLSRFPVDTLKIDRSFICEVPFNASNVALVEAIIAMAHGLHLRVIAEGVETREQLDFLRTRGCDLAQGYFFSAPVPADAFATLAYDWRQISARAG